MATEQEGIKVYLPSAEAQALRAKAKQEDRTVTAVLRRLIREYLDPVENAAKPQKAAA